MASPARDAGPAGKTPLWEDFVDVLYAPTQLFERRRDGRFGLALLVLTVLSALLFFALRSALEPAFDASFQQGIRAQAAQNGQALTADQIAAGRRIAGIVVAVGGVVGTPVIVFLLGFLIWLAGKPFGSTATLGQATMVSTYANMPRVVTSVVVGVLAMVSDPARLTSTAALTLSPARFMPADTSPVTLALLSRLDVTALWVTALLGIGIAVVGKVARSKGLAAAATVWLVTSLFTVASAARQAPAS